MNSGVMTRETKIMSVKQGDSIMLEAPKFIPVGDIKKRATNTVRFLRSRHDRDICSEQDAKYGEHSYYYPVF